MNKKSHVKNKVFLIARKYALGSQADWLSMGGGGGGGENIPFNH